MPTNLTRGEQSLVDLASVTQVATVNRAVQSSRSALTKLETLLADTDQVAMQSDSATAAAARHITKVRSSLSLIADSIQQ